MFSEIFKSYNALGESIPLAKSPITELPTPVTDEDRRIDIRRLARHVLFSGTRVLQARPTHLEPYVKAVVLRTGFLTVKGDLVRAILHPRPLDTDFTLDSFRFLSIMAVIAVAGSVYIWIILVRTDICLYSSVAWWSSTNREAADLLTLVIANLLSYMIVNSENQGFKVKVLVTSPSISL